MRSSRAPAPSSPPCSSSRPAAGDQTSPPKDVGATAFPSPATGRLVRVVSDLDQPAGLAVAPDGSLVGMRGVLSTPGVFGIDGSGKVRTSRSGGASRGPLRGIPAAATVTDTAYLMVTGAGAVQAIDPNLGSLRGFTSLPETAGAWGGALLDLRGDRVLQFGREWYDVTLDGNDNPRVEVRDAPVEDALASAQDGSGAVVLTETEIARLDNHGRATEHTPWQRPAQLAGMRATSATSDRAHGLVVTLVVESTTRGVMGESGAVLHVAADGSAEILASGRKSASAAGCGDEDLPALESSLSQPTSVVVWAHRLLVSDTGCGSVLQLPLPHR